MADGTRDTRAFDDPRSRNGNPNSQRRYSYNSGPEMSQRDYNSPQWPSRQHSGPPPPEPRWSGQQSYPPPPGPSVPYYADDREPYDPAHAWPPPPPVGSFRDDSSAPMRPLPSPTYPHRPHMDPPYRGIDERGRIPSNSRPPLPPPSPPRRAWGDSRHSDAIEDRQRGYGRPPPPPAASSGYSNSPISSRGPYPPPFEETNPWANSSPSSYGPDRSSRWPEARASNDYPPPPRGESSRYSPPLPSRGLPPPIPSSSSSEMLPPIQRGSGYDRPPPGGYNRYPPRGDSGRGPPPPPPNGVPGSDYPPPPGSSKPYPHSRMPPPPVSFETTEDVYGRLGAPKIKDGYSVPSNSRSSLNMPPGGIGARAEVFETTEEVYGHLGAPRRQVADGPRSGGAHSHGWDRDPHWDRERDRDVSMGPGPGPYRDHHQPPSRRPSQAQAPVKEELDEFGRVRRNDGGYRVGPGPDTRRSPPPLPPPTSGSNAVLPLPPGARPSSPPLHASRSYSHSGSGSASGSGSSRLLGRPYWTGDPEPPVPSHSRQRSAEDDVRPFSPHHSQHPSASPMPSPLPTPTVSSASTFPTAGGPNEAPPESSSAPPVSRPRSRAQAASMESSFQTSVPPSSGPKDGSSFSVLKMSSAWRVQVAPSGSGAGTSATTNEPQPLPNVRWGSNTTPAPAPARAPSPVPQQQQQLHDGAPPSTSNGSLVSERSADSGQGHFGQFQNDASIRLEDVMPSLSSSREAPEAEAEPEEEHVPVERATGASNRRSQRTRGEAKAVESGPSASSRRVGTKRDLTSEIEGILASDAPAHKLLSSLLSVMPRSGMQDEDLVDAILDENHRVSELPVYTELPADERMDMDVDEKAVVAAVVSSEDVDMGDGDAPPHSTDATGEPPLNDAKKSSSPSVPAKTSSSSPAPRALKRSPRITPKMELDIVKPEPDPADKDLVDDILSANRSLLQPVPPLRDAPIIDLVAEYEASAAAREDEKINAAVVSVLVTTVANESARLDEKNDKLMEDYKVYHQNWKLHRLRLERLEAVRARKQGLAQPSDDPRNGRRALGGIGGGGGGPAITLGDAARSDLELDQIMQSLVNEDLTNPEILSRKNAAVIPEMLSVTNPRALAVKYDDRSGLVRDPVFFSHELLNPGHWTADEHRTFIDAFLATPKQFGRIADQLPHKTHEQCVLYYYLHKKEINFKGLIAKQGPRRGRRGGRRAKVKGNALLKDIQQHIDEEESNSRADSSPTPENGGAATSDEDHPIALSRGRRAQNSRLSNLLAEATESDDDNYSEDNGGAGGEDGPRKKARGDGDASKGRGRGRGRAHTTFWNAQEKDVFMALLPVHGKNWAIISDNIPGKTPLQVRNYFQNHSVELGLPAIAAKADKPPRGAGSTRKPISKGPNPQSTPIPDSPPPQNVVLGPTSPPPAVVPRPHPASHAGSMDTFMRNYNPALASPMPRPPVSSHPSWYSAASDSNNDPLDREHSPSPMGRLPPLEPSLPASTSNASADSWPGTSSHTRPTGGAGNTGSRFPW